MIRFSERKTVPYTPQQVFDLVVDIERYPEFIEWVTDAKVYPAEDDGSFKADMTAGFKLMSESFTTRVQTIAPRDAGDGTGQVDVKHVKGPFKRLTTNWTFHPVDDASKTEIEFSIAFKFNSFFLQKAMGKVFGEVTKRLVSAFEKRAAELYN